MTPEEIYKKIENTYNSEKGKGFITHLLRSFFPQEKAYNVWFTPDDPSTLKCCLTGVKLYAKDTLVEKVMGTPETFKENFLNNSKRILGQTIEDSDALKQQKEAARETFQFLAVASEESNKFLSPDAYQQLFNFYATNILNGNKHIGWIAKNERAKSYIKHGKEQGYITSKKEEKAVKHAAEGAKMSLGELSVLQDLKKKLENK